MKRFGALFFLFLLFLQSGGLFWAYKAGHYGLKLDRKERLEDPTANFVNLTIPLDAYHQSLKDDGLEIMWKGVLYDIKSVSYHASHVEIVAMADHKEANLISRFEAFLQKTNAHQKQLPIPLNILSILIYIAPYNGFCVQAKELKPLLVHPKQFATSTHASEINSPPPELKLI